MEPNYINYQYQETASQPFRTQLCKLPLAAHKIQTLNTHDETNEFSICTHLKLHLTQFKQLTQTQLHPLHELNAHSDPPNMKSTIFHNNDHTHHLRSRHNNLEL